ncbi:MAG: phosphoribosylamine--glycine ligase [Nitrospirota bacterium]|nr:phosphoribosylamine--glycine ligase [Nitrospirota bacterium]
MKILVVGSGGREHALVWKLAQSPRVSKIFCAPGNAGIGQIATCVPLTVEDISGLASFAEKESIALTVVGPEASLALGIADTFRQRKLKVFGPTKNAARVESSKAFAKDLMVRQHIPTPEARSFESLAPALEYLGARPVPIVIKADGLAQGKGVVVAQSHAEAKDALTNMLDRHVFGKAGQRVLIEDCVKGEELTVMAFADGKTVVPMVAAQDHKRIGEGDTGPNTGGMGAYAPAPLVTSMLLNRILKEVLYPAIDGLTRVGSPFYGVLYAGLMIHNGDPYVLEFNARFGDPETQVVLPLLKTDLVDILEAVVEHRLDQMNIEWSDQSALCVALTSGGYPGSYDKGFPISGLDEDWTPEGVVVFHAGTAVKDTRIVTAGGRVLGVTGTGDDLAVARDKAYSAVQKIDFEGMYFRKDIAHRVLAGN